MIRWFWKGNRESSPELEAIQQLKEQNSIFEEQYKVLTEQVTKLSRLQYKTSKDTQEKMGQLHESVNTLIEKQENDTDDKVQRIYQMEVKMNEMIHSLIRWLDDLDILYTRLAGEEQEAWSKILNGWSKDILVRLEGLGIHELQVLGTSFDPIVAEAMATIPKKEAAMKYKGFSALELTSYQIVEVLQRGFRWEDGSLLRKAQVITIEKDGFYEE
ncbi:MAG TPA: nucleotide exchange factor GrpE [Bacillales bacterium]|nr:nucleotide exchange factor GrpE [Bacillales bacterium]